jgi:hypothetical protein
MTDHHRNVSVSPGTTLQDELLEDLRLTAPVPAAPPAVDRPVAAARTEPGGTPTVLLRLTPLRWSRPSRQAGPGRPAGITLSAGPVQIFLSGFSG